MKQIDVKQDGTPVITGNINALFTLASSDEAGKIQIDPDTGIMSVNGINSIFFRTINVSNTSRIWVPLVTASNPVGNGATRLFAMEFYAGSRLYIDSFNVGRLVVRLRTGSTSVTTSSLKLKYDFSISSDGMTFGWTSTGNSTGGVFTLYASCASYFSLSYRMLPGSESILVDNASEALDTQPNGYNEIVAS